MSKKLLISVISTLTIVLLSSCSKVSDQEIAKATPNTPQANLQQVLEVYKNPSCGCCEKWVAHMNTVGFQTNIHNRADLSGLKQQKGIQPRYRSCHTAISKNGYVFEGHVPAKFIKQFLADKPENALGLSVPGMGPGTPGMEMGDKFMPYKILLLKKDGSSEIFASINSYKEQF